MANPPARYSLRDPWPAERQPPNTIRRQLAPSLAAPVTLIVQPNGGGEPTECGETKLYVCSQRWFGYHDDHPGDIQEVEVLIKRRMSLLAMMVGTIDVSFWDCSIPGKPPNQFAQIITSKLDTKRFMHPSGGQLSFRWHRESQTSEELLYIIGNDSEGPVATCYLSSKPQWNCRLELHDSEMRLYRDRDALHQIIVETFAHLLTARNLLDNILG